MTQCLLHRKHVKSGKFPCKNLVFCRAEIAPKLLNFAPFVHGIFEMYIHTRIKPSSKLCIMPLGNPFLMDKYNLSGR